MDNLQIATRNSFDPQQYLSEKSAYTQHPILFNIIQVSDISRSRLNQLDEWQEYEDPNSVSVDRVSKYNNKKYLGNRIIREVDMSKDNELTFSNFTRYGGIYKLLLKDNFDNYCFAYEYNDSLQFLRQNNSTGTPLGIPLGGRLLVNKGTLVMNGVLMLEKIQCQYLGIDENDSSLAEKLNSGIVKKHIDLLNEELISNQ
ncbi:uncharacterized protein AC631_02590 [Debaryomyces fabryi]|uniref:RecQ mediated genome instability protein 1 OB-fold domain-containing protein n=1 Tax=Debaryomyces fabryi TaxID=58627 RepID=A0A0V1PZQ6_9ASCO|nr:uncharacterized protein AC631_02590 [Debaryomyces fabryi]KSA01650.1 hypothetical protein AC631_02590 [Debaryomyces fabryi]CUM45411.1 unnamed protein product [Debaryomyces fabryi]